MAFGYEVVPPAAGAKEAGDRRINQAEAEIVTRIFREYAAGRSARHIAKKLNAEGVAGPGGRLWIDTTIRGQAERGTGLHNNTLYIGELSWNRCSYIKDPRTGRRVARVNDSAEWEVVSVPELRIIDQTLWEAAKARQKANSFEIKKTDEQAVEAGGYRARFLLSGVLACGCCGGGYTIIGRDRYGCATRRGRGTCDNGHTITRQHIEARVLDGLRERMLSPELVEAFIRGYEQELAALQRHAGTERLHVSREFDQVNRRLEGVLSAIENGAWNDALKARLTELECAKAKLATKLEGLGAPAPPRLHPNAAMIYRAKVADL